MITATTGETTDSGNDRGDNFTPSENDGTSAEEMLAAAEAKAEKVAADKLIADKATAAEKATADETDDEDDDETLTDEEKEVKAAEKGKKGKDTRIPLARHKEVLQAERAKTKAAQDARTELEQRYASQQGGKAIAQTNAQITTAENELLTLEEGLNKALIDGDAAAAAKSNKEIRALERSISEAKIAMASQAAESRAYERARYDTTVERIEAAYDVLNEDHESYDADKMETIMRVASSYKDVTDSKALQLAVKRIMGEPGTTKQTAATEVKPKVSEDDAAAAAKAIADERKKAAVAKGLRTKQPPAAGSVGENSDTAGGDLGKNIMRLSQTDFSKIDEKTLATLRGDELS